jgi:tubulin---tyrosine ligase
MEAALCGKKAIALSYAFDSREHDPVVIAAASKRAVQLIHKLYAEWPEGVDLYNINVPVRKGVEFTKILYTQILQNKWTTGSSLEALPFESSGELDPDQEEKEIREGSSQTTDNELNADAPGLLTRRGHRQYKWAPNFADVRNSVEQAGHGDGYTVMQGWIRSAPHGKTNSSSLRSPSVTPLVASFWHAPHLKGEIEL